MDNIKNIERMRWGIWMMIALSSQQGVRCYTSFAPKTRINIQWSKIREEGCWRRTTCLRDSSETLFEEDVPLFVGDNQVLLANPEGVTVVDGGGDVINQILSESTVLEEVEGLHVPQQELSVSNMTEDLHVIPDIEQEIEVVEPKNNAAPSVSSILRFAIAAIGVWLCSPILSLIDTSAVGLLSGTAQQAALNPAVSVTEYTALLMAFMYTGTTNLVAGAYEADRGNDGNRTSKTLINSLRLSAYVGAILGVAQIVLSKSLLRAIIGNDAIDPAVFSAAWKYVSIRALGMPAAAVIGAAQAACLGLKDIKSPLLILVSAALINLLGDCIFVGSSHAWIGGAAGAAWATVFSQYAALSMFLAWLSAGSKSMQFSSIQKTVRKLKSGLGNTRSRVGRTVSPLLKRTKQIKLPSFRRSTTPKLSFENKEPSYESQSTRGILHKHFHPSQLLSIPNNHILKQFSPYFLPVTITSAGRVSAYVAMSHVISSKIGTISMAAQQVILSVFFCLTPVGDSLSLTAQSFVPSLLERRDITQTERKDILIKMTMNFLKAGAIFAAMTLGVVGCIPLMSPYFTSDARVWDLVNSVVPYVAGWFSVHSIMLAAEGVLLGRKDLGFLGKAYAVYFFAVPYFMLQLKKQTALALTAPWSIFLVYQMSRFTIWMARLFFINKQKKIFRRKKQAVDNQMPAELVAQ